MIRNMKAPTRAILTLLIAPAAVWAQYIISTVAGGAPLPMLSIDASSSIGQPSNVAVSPSGDLYFSGYVYSVYKVDSRGLLTRVAGNGRSGFSGDGGPATSAGLSSPTGLALDAAGNLYIADLGNQRVRKVSTNGIITTFAGNGSWESSGDGGPATSAAIGRPVGVAADKAGNIFISDSFFRPIVRKVSSNGIITTVWSIGRGTAPEVGAGSVSVDASGNLYVVDASRNVIYKVPPSGNSGIIAGNGTSGYSGDGGPATNAQLRSPRGLVVDATGNLYFADDGNHRIRKLGTDGIINTLCGDGVAGYSGDGGPAQSARLQYPSDLAADTAGNLFVADYGNSRIRKIATSGIIATVAGNGTDRILGDGGPATSGRLDWPYGLAVDTVGNIYIADSGNHRVRKVATNGIISTLAGNGVAGYTGDGGPAERAQLNRPIGVAVDRLGNLYIADSDNNRIRKVTPNGSILTVAGTGSRGFSGDGGFATSAQLNFPTGVAMDAAGNLYVADAYNFRARKVSAEGIITTVAGSGIRGYVGEGNGGPATGARLTYPWGVALDGAGNLYLADELFVWKVSTDSIIAKIIGPTGGAKGVAVDTMGNIYIGNVNSASLYKISANGAVATIAGTSSFGYSGDGGPATSAQLSGPSGIAVDSSGNVYFSDISNSTLLVNNAIRMLKPVSFGPSARLLANASSNVAGSVSPGEIVVVYGARVGPEQFTIAGPDEQGHYGTALASTRVLFNSIPAPMLYTSATQASAIVPYGVKGSTAVIQIEYQGFRSDPIALPIAASTPGLFTVDSTGKGQAAALNDDGSLNSPSRPAKAGSIVVLYATGEGQTSSAGVDGQPAAAPLPKPLLPVDVTIDEKHADVIYDGGAPGAVPGLMQINVRIPSDTQAGNAIPISVQIGSASSQAGVTIAVE